MNATPVNISPRLLISIMVVIFLKQSVHEHWLLGKLSLDKTPVNASSFELSLTLKLHVLHLKSLEEGL